MPLAFLSLYPNFPLLGGQRPASRSTKLTHFLNFQQEVRRAPSRTLLSGLSTSIAILKLHVEDEEPQGRGLGPRVAARGRALWRPGVGFGHE